MSCPILACDTNVLPIASAYEQNATNTLSVAGEIRGSLIALIGITANALRSFALSCFGLISTGSQVLDLFQLAAMLLVLPLPVARYLPDTSVSRSS